ncbi:MULTISPECIES: restriction endonuclease subunit S [Bacillus]|uniref:restriction endonuclease subunit S n=1 Tax=Bacillus TaxID=1386 RepID=UPI0010727939|nr:restriction endonuclease subunit S [Bacillus subtilis]MBU8614136.1 restriction endonuclease subunit S [Bacillus subtilis]MBU8720105.1 restriction endonuclease subunit S [Bacillus subtilis]MEC4032641.1 restriction endonuclease subunit S [Bacillus subtilis]TWG53492.1 type I restriction enzyme S subunit [Bacillus subtilis J23]TWG67073.1 type I restriction enzyme S subunit [Bacillus subtilis J25]
MGNKRTPEIRFSGFTGEWEQRQIGNHAEILTGGTPKTQIKEYWEPSEIPWMSSGEVNKKRLSSTDNMISFLGFENSSARWVKENSILIALAGQGKTRGTVAINEIPLTTNQSIAAIVPKEELHYEFVFQSLEKRYEELRLISSGDGTRGGLNKQLVADVVIISPSIEEQIKIGDLFKQLDDIIALHQQELTTLKQTKQGFLQKMFPKEGESVPEVRFPGFTGEWEQRKFKDFISKAGKKNTMGENYPAYSVSNKVGLVSQSEQFDGSRLDNLDKTSYKLVNPNEFAYNPARINVGSIAFNDLNKTVIVSSLYVILKMSEELDNEFILQFIKSQFFIDEVRKNTEGSVREYLFFENFKNIKFPYTSSKDEQTKIGTFFKQLDDTIALHQRELDALQETKKAFLQKMFV